MERCDPKFNVVATNMLVIKIWIRYAANTKNTGIQSDWITHKKQQTELEENYEHGI